MSRLGEEVRRLREDKQLSQAELASMARISPAYVSCIEDGKYKNISIKVLTNLASALNVSPLYLLECAGLYDRDGELLGLGTFARLIKGLDEQTIDEIIEFARFKQRMATRSRRRPEEAEE